MTNYIVDCRYIRTTTPVGVPDFTIEVEAECPEDAMRIAARSHAWDDFTVVGCQDTLSLIESLRSHVRILAAFGLEMSRKNREADVAEFEALASINRIAVPEEEDNQEDLDREEAIAAERRDIEAKELEAQYGYRGHMDYTIDMWIDDDSSRLDYWPWVAERLAETDKDWKEADEDTRPSQT